MTDLAWPRNGGEMADRIRGHDWAATQLGPVEAWPGSLKAVTDLLLASGFPMVALWGPGLVQIYNDGYRALMGVKHPAGLGQPTRQCWPEVWHINAPIYERVRGGGETLTFEDKLYPITRSGILENAWFTLSYSPLRDEAGSIEGVLVTVFETTQQHRAERELRASEERFRALATAGSYLIYRMSPDWRLMHQLHGREFLTDTVGPTVNWSDAYILPEDRPAVFAAIGAAIGSRSLFELEHRVRRADGSIGWVLSRAVPMFGQDGDIVEWFGAAFERDAAKVFHLS